jgi:hypothetical protein
MHSMLRAGFPKARLDSQVPQLISQTQDETEKFVPKRNKANRSPKETEQLCRETSTYLFNTKPKFSRKFKLKSLIINVQWSATWHMRFSWVNCHKLLEVS